MNNLFSFFKKIFLKLIGKKLKLYKTHVMPTHTFFSLKKITIKAKDLQSPWITNGIKKIFLK